MVYLTDNLAYFPYMVQDEPLYLINQIDLVISNSGTNLLSNFRDGLTPLPGQENHNNLPGKFFEFILFGFFFFVKFIVFFSVIFSCTKPFR